MSMLKAFEPSQALQYRVLNEILGIGKIACPGWQPAARKSLQNGNVASEEIVERLRVAGANTLDQLGRRSGIHLGDRAHCA